MSTSRHRRGRRQARPAIGAVGPIDDDPVDWTVFLSPVGCLVFIGAARFVAVIVGGFIVVFGQAAGIAVFVGLVFLYAWGRSRNPVTSSGYTRQ